MKKQMVAVALLIAACLTGCERQIGTPEYTMPEVEPELVGNLSGTPEYVSEYYDMVNSFEQKTLDALSNPEYDSMRAQIQANFEIVDAGIIDTQAQFEVWKDIMSQTNLELKETDSYYQKFLKLCQALGYSSMSDYLDLDSYLGHMGLDVNGLTKLLDSMAGLPDDMTLSLPAWEKVEEAMEDGSVATVFMIDASAIPQEEVDAAEEAWVAHQKGEDEVPEEDISIEDKDDTAIDYEGDTVSDDEEVESDAKLGNDMDIEVAQESGAVLEQYQK